MYSRAFGIESDGVYGEASRRVEEAEEQAAAVAAQPKGGFNIKQKLKSFDTEDLLLIAIAVLLLTDGSKDNDILVLLIAFLLFF